MLGAMGAFLFAHTLSSQTLIDPGGGTIIVLPEPGGGNGPGGGDDGGGKGSGPGGGNGSGGDNGGGTGGSADACSICQTWDDYTQTCVDNGNPCEPFLGDGGPGSAVELCDKIKDPKNLKCLFKCYDFNLPPGVDFDDVNGVVACYNGQPVPCVLDNDYGPEIDGCLKAHEQHHIEDPANRCVPQVGPGLGGGSSECDAYTAEIECLNGLDPNTPGLKERMEKARIQKDNECKKEGK